MERRELEIGQLKKYENTVGSLIREYKGPNKKVDYIPLGNNMITIVKSTVLLLGISMSALGLWYGTFGCITQFIMKNYSYVTQITLFLVIFLNLFIVMAESQNAVVAATPTWLSFIMAFITWIFLNMVMNIGDSWLFVNIPFWPGPLTWWGAIIIICLVVYFIDEQRVYWEKNKNNIYTEKNKIKSNLYINFELVTLGLLVLIITIRFFIELFKQKGKLKSKFNIIKFFFGLETRGKDDKATGHCNPKYNKKMDKELKLSIKNSLWTRIKKQLFNS